MAALAGDSIDTTSYDLCTQHAQHLTVVENTMAVLFPSLPVVGYAATILEGMHKAVLVSDVGMESVALKAKFNPACDEGGGFPHRTRQLCRRKEIWANKSLTDTRQIKSPGVGVALVALTRVTRRRSFWTVKNFILGDVL